MTKINLFKARKGDHVLHIFGTQHNIGIEFLPQEVVNFIMSHKFLVRENEDIFKPYTLEELAGYKFVLQGEELSPLVYFNDFYQKMIVEKIQTYLDFKRSKIPLDKLNINGLYILYVESLYNNGMDRSFDKAFLSKEIKGLESRQEVLNIIKLEVSIEDFTQLVFNSDSDSAHKNYWSLMQNLQYFSNLCIDKNNASSCDKLATRNNNWMPKITELDSSHIISVGVQHLFYKNGILNKLKLDGYSIERMNSSFEFTVPSDEEIIQGIKTASLHEYMDMVSACLEQLIPNEREIIIKELMGNTAQINQESGNVEATTFSDEGYANESESNLCSDTSELAGIVYLVCPLCGST